MHAPGRAGAATRTTALRVGRLQPEGEPLDSFQTDLVGTHANAFESLGGLEPLRVYAAGVSMAEHHASLVS